MMTNKELSEALRVLSDLLIIGGYEETHATRYARLAYTISRMPEEAETLSKEGRLCDIPGVGPTIAALISEYLSTGSCRKQREWERRVPRSVLELLTIPGLGAKTVRRLYQELGINSLQTLRRAVYEGSAVLTTRLDTRTATTIRRYLSLRHEQESLNIGLFADSAP